MGYRPALKTRGTGYRAVRSIAVFCVVILGVFGGCNSLLYGQDVVVAQNNAATDVEALPRDAQPPAPAETAPPPETLATTDIPVASETAAAPAVSDPEPLTPAEGVALNWPPQGPIRGAEIRGGESAAQRVFHYGISLGVRGIYDDNVNLTQFNKVSATYVAIEPAIAIGLGDVIGRQGNYIRLDYAPSVLIFADDPDPAKDAVQHVIRLESQYRLSRLTLQLEQDVQLLDDPNVPSIRGPGEISNFVNLDVAGRSQVDLYRTHLGWSYDLTEKTFLSGALEYSIYDYGSLTGSGFLPVIGFQPAISWEQFFGNIFINYRYSPKLVIGIGGSGGYTWVDFPDPNQPFENVDVRMTYQLTGKISLYASGGVEFRQFDGAGIGSARGGSYVTGVYELGATYQPFAGTEISVRGNRRIEPSAVLVAQDLALSNIIVGVRQRLFQRFYIGVTGGYENGNYFNTVSGVNATRDDNYWEVEPAVDFQIFKRCSVGAYYLHREDNSSLSQFSYDDNQVGGGVKIVF